MRKFLFTLLVILIGSTGFAGQSKAVPLCFGERDQCKKSPDYVYKERFIENSSGDCVLTFIKTETRANVLFAIFQLAKKMPISRLQIDKKAVKIADINVANGTRLDLLECKFRLRFEKIFDNPDAVLVRVNEDPEQSANAMPLCFGERDQCKKFPDYAYKERFIENSSGDCVLTFIKTETSKNALFAIFQLAKKVPISRLGTNKKVVKIAEFNVAKGSRLDLLECKFSLRFEKIFDNPYAVLVREFEDPKPSASVIN